MNETKPKKILIIRLSSLGDIILTAPLIRNLSAAFPDAKLDFLVKPQFEKAVRGNRLINHIIPFSGLISAAAIINEAHYDIALDLHATARTRLLCMLINAKRIIRYQKASLARRLFVKMRIPNPALEKHTLERYLDTLTALGISARQSFPRLEDWDLKAASLPQVPKRLIIIQTAFLGDCVLTLPLIKRIRELLPKAKIFILTRADTQQVFLAADIANTEIIADNKKTARSKAAETKRIIQKLKSLNIDTAIIPHRSFRSAFIALKSGIPIRIGFAESAGRFFLTHKLPFSWLMHDAKRNLSLLLPITKELKVSFPNFHENKIDNIITKENEKEIIAGLNPGSAWATKRWPAENWAELAKMLFAKTGKRVLIIGGAKELKWNRKIADMTGSAALDMTGKTSLPELMSQISKLKVFISNDSGPMHIACALKVPTIGIFGPTTKELGFFPYGPGHMVLQANLACRPCTLHGSNTCPRGHFLCMRLITPEQVYKAALRQLRYGQGQKVHNESRGKGKENNFICQSL